MGTVDLLEPLGCLPDHPFAEGQPAWIVNPIHLAGHPAKRIAPLATADTHTLVLHASATDVLRDATDSTGTEAGSLLPSATHAPHLGKDRHTCKGRRQPQGERPVIKIFQNHLSLP